MRAVVLVDAAPGYEAAVKATLQDMEEVVNVADMKQGNYDMAALLEVDDAGKLERLLTSRIRIVSGVRGIERLDPAPDHVLAKLET